MPLNPTGVRALHACSCAGGSYEAKDVQKDPKESSEYRSDTRAEVARALTSLINAAQLEGNDKLADKIFGEDHDCPIYEDLRRLAR